MKRRFTALGRYFTHVDPNKNHEHLIERGTTSLWQGKKDYFLFRVFFLRDDSEFSRVCSRFYADFAQPTTVKLKSGGATAVLHQCPARSLSG